MMAGMLIAAIHAVACIQYKADQVVTGTAINILMIGLPAFLERRFLSVIRLHAADSQGAPDTLDSDRDCLRPRPD